MPQNLNLIGLIAQTNFRSIGLAIALITFFGFVVAVYANSRKSRDEIGAEIELAANRKEYLDDEGLEGPRLDRSLSFALVSLLFISVAFTFYTVAEPGRQEGAVATRIATFERRGEDTYVNGAGCVACHAADGGGGEAPFVLQDADGQFIGNVTWTAPALNNLLLRYSEDEVTHILNFGRNGSPMAAWGTPGGGPLTDQAVANVITYLETLQVQSINPVDIAAAGDDVPGNNEGDLEDEESQLAQEEADQIEAAIRAEVERSLEDGEFETLGEAVFNLGLFSNFGAGSYSCARCHTAGWSLGIDAVPNILDEGVAGCGGGVSGIGFNLCGDSLQARFPNDTWKLPDGEWAPPDGLTNSEGFRIVLALDGTEILLDDRARPVNEDGDPFIVLPSPLIEVDSVTVDAAEEDADAEDGDDDAAVEAAAGATLGEAGDLAFCQFESGLFTPDTGATYAVDPGVEPEVGPDGSIVDPAPLDLSQFDGPIYQTSSGRLVNDCEVTAMPERTSQSQFDFIFNGANAGEGYGVGGQSSAGQMPGFGRLLPEDYIQAVVDYERGLN